MDDLTPLPYWKQRVNAGRGAWRRGKAARAKAYTSLKVVGQKLLTLAISVVGAILISMGAHQIYAPSGFIVGGILCWVLLWSAEKDKERR